MELLKTFVRNIIEQPKSTITGIVAGVAGILVAFGIDINEETRNQIVTAAAIILPVVFGLVFRDWK